MYTLKLKFHPSTVTPIYMEKEKKKELRAKRNGHWLIKSKEFL